MAQSFLARVAGRYVVLAATIISAGVASAGKLVGLGSDGRLDASVLPLGVGANVVTATAAEAIGAGKFVELFYDVGVLKMRLADNSNLRVAWGYVKTAVDADAGGTAYRLNTVNANLSGLVPGADYWLGTAGGIISTPLDAEEDAGTLDQYLGRASSATELVTVEHSPVYL